MLEREELPARQPSCVGANSRIDFFIQLFAVFISQHLYHHHRVYEIQRRRMFIWLGSWPSCRTSLLLMKIDRGLNFSVPSFPRGCEPCYVVTMLYHHLMSRVYQEVGTNHWGPPHCQHYSLVRLGLFIFCIVEKFIKSDSTSKTVF